MSSSYFRVGSQFWHDATVRAWDQDTQFIALYVLTSPHRITEGLFRLPAEYALADTRFTGRRLQKALDRLESDGFIERDGDMLLIVNALKWQAPKSKSNRVHAVKKAIAFSTPLLGRLVELASDHCTELAEALVEAKPELSTYLKAGSDAS